MLNEEKALKFVSNRREKHLAQLIEFLCFPSISTLLENKEDVQATAEWLAGHMRGIGLEEVEIYPTEGHPIVYGQWLEAEDRPTLLVYGHYDVQPVDPLEEWLSDPFRPEIREENLYARGASDDKGQLFTYIKAAEAYLWTEGALPVNVKFLFEGEEEVGSKNLEPFVESHRELLRADVAAISDGLMLGPDKPSIVYALRGLTYVEVEVVGPKRDLHSGSFGGAIHNPAEVLAKLISQLKDEHGRILIPGFYDRVLPLTEEERQELSKLPFDEEEFRNEAGVPRTWGEEGYTVLEQISARPTLEVNGIVGGFTGEGAKTIIPARARAKISMRLVSEQDPAEIARLFQEYVESICPDTVRIAVETHGLAEPALVDISIPEMKAAIKAYEKGFGKKPVFIREGGTIPVVSLLKKELGLATILLGFGLPDDNLHAPNEKIYLPNFYRGIDTLIHFYNALAKC